MLTWLCTIEMQLTSSFSASTIDVVRVVAHSNQTKSSLSSIHQTIRTACQESLAFITLIVKIALVFVSNRFGSRFAGIAPLKTRSLASSTGSSEVIVRIVVWTGPLGSLRHSASWGRRGAIRQFVPYTLPKHEANMYYIPQPLFSPRDVVQKILNALCVMILSMGTCIEEWDSVFYLKSQW